VFIASEANRGRRRPVRRFDRVAPSVAEDIHEVEAAATPALLTAALIIAAFATFAVFAALAALVVALLRALLQWLRAALVLGKLRAAPIQAAALFRLHAGDELFQFAAIEPHATAVGHISKATSLRFTSVIEALQLGHIKSGMNPPWFGQILGSGRRRQTCIAAADFRNAS
jgi:hypothetical protein